MLSALSATMGAAVAAPAEDTSAETSAETTGGLMHQELIQFFMPTLTLLEHLELDEFILLLAAIFPVTAGLVAMFRVFTNRDNGDSGGGDADHGLSAQTEAALTQSATTVGRLELQLTDLQRTHEGRFADLHKDLAGIVWELSKLRADMARWQVRVSGAWEPRRAFARDLRRCVSLALTSSSLAELASLVACISGLVSGGNTVGAGSGLLDGCGAPGVVREGVAPFALLLREGAKLLDFGCCPPRDCRARRADAPRGGPRRPLFPHARASVSLDHHAEGSPG